MTKTKPRSIPYTVTLNECRRWAVAELAHNGQYELLPETIRQSRRDAITEYLKVACPARVRDFWTEQRNRGLAVTVRVAIVLAEDGQRRMPL